MKSDTKSQSHYPKKWHQVYAQGTKEGNEEQRFFKALTRHPKFDWRSIATIASETGLDRKRVEEIVHKYHKMGIVFQSPKNDDHWGYWEDHKSLVPKPEVGIAAKDLKSRVDKSLGVPLNSPSGGLNKKAPKKAATKP